MGKVLIEGWRCLEHRRFGKLFWKALVVCFTLFGSWSARAQSVNLLTNPGFESGTTGYGWYSGATVVTGQAHSGTYAIRVGTGSGGISQNILSKVTAGKSYRLTGYGKLGASNELGNFGVKFKSSTGAVLLDKTARVTTTSYAPYALDFVVPSGASQGYVHLWHDAGSSYVYGDDLSLVELTNASPGPSPTPAPSATPAATATPAPSPTATPSASAPAIPYLDRWKSDMTYYGRNHCNQSQIDAAIGSWGVATEANVWYYDGARVYHQIAKHTGDSSFLTCANYVLHAYGDWVLAITNGRTTPTSSLQGWRVFPHGSYQNYVRTGNPTSREVVLRLAKYSAWVNTIGNIDCSGTRETAYLINAFVTSLRMGEPRHPNLSVAVDKALSITDLVFKNTGYCSTGNNKPFMWGLVMEALIYYWENTGYSDTRIPPATKTIADGLWAKAWVSTSRAFKYDFTGINGEPTGPAPDLNQLIAHGYAWLWQRGAGDIYRTRGDEIFTGGVLAANLAGGKQFSQNYRSSFNFVKWRSSPPGAIQPLTGY